MHRRTTAPQSEFQSEGKRNSILVVDDDTPMNILFELYLRSWFTGDIRKARNGREALDITQECQPELIVMDIKMPILDGITTTRVLRENGYENPILIVTGYADSNKNECLQAGASEVLAKPISEEQFTRTIKNLINAMLGQT